MRIKKSLLIVMLLVLLVFSISFNVRFVARSYSEKKERELLNQTLPYIFPFFRDMPHEDFVQIKKYYRATFQDLKDEVNMSIILPEGAKYSFYFEALNSGAYIGTLEKEKFSPASLRKVPMLAALYKKFENNEVQRTDKVEILPDDVNTISGPLGNRGSGVVLTVDELINYTTYYSDNTAAAALLRVVGKESYTEAMFNMGLSYKTFIETMDSPDTPLSAKEYSNVFRSLYYASWLTRISSNELLDKLTKTGFTDGLPAGVPSNILVSHKTAFWIEKSQHHDCGIIYYPNDPYILCIMVLGLDESSSNRVTAKISKIIYNYMDMAVSAG